MLNIFTLFHVALSLIGIGSGVVVLFGFLDSKRMDRWSTRMDRWSTIFLLTTVATSVTGFLFPFHRFLPSYGVGIVSLAVLVVAVLASRRFRLAGDWRKTYVISATSALYLNVFVLVAQMFQKIPALHALAPTQAEPPFAVAQGVVLLLFVMLAIRATIKFHPVPARMSASTAAA